LSSSGITSAESRKTAITGVGASERSRPAAAQTKPTASSHHCTPSVVVSAAPMKRKFISARVGTSSGYVGPQRIRKYCGSRPPKK